MKNKIQKCVFVLKDKIKECKHKAKITMFKDKYPDFLGETEYDNGETKFIWGVKSSDDLCQSPACLHTINDIDIVYSRKDNRYILSIETAYWFDDKSEEIKYLEYLLFRFSQYMQLNKLPIDEPYRFWMSQPQALFEAESIPELYTNFKMIVEGYRTLYTNRKDA